MKKLFFIALLLMTGLSAYSQYYLNKRQSLGYSGTVYTGLFPTDSCIYIKGVLTDSSYSDGTFLAKFSLEGELIWKKEYPNVSVDYTSWYSKLIKNQDGNLVFTGYGFVLVQNTSHFRGFIVEYTPNGDLVRSKDFYSPNMNANENFINPLNIVQANNGDYIVGGYLNVSPPVSAFVARFDAELDLKWMRTYGSDHIDACLSLLETADGDIIAGGEEYDESFVNNPTQRHLITTFDGNGQEELWRWSYPEVFTPEGGGIIWDMLSQPDGSIVAATSVTRETSVNGGTSTREEYPKLIKLNPDRSLAWTNRMGNQHFSSVKSHLRRVVTAINGSGFVAAGNAGAFATDSTHVYHTLGIIQQVSEMGDSVWLSYLYHPINELIPEHEIFDMVPAADQSGYWLCGQAAQIITGQPTHQGWLLFVDQYGCAVPGCRTVNTAEGTPLTDKILIFPNPASEYAAIWHSGYTFSKGQFRIVSEQGQLMQSWKAPVDELTTMIDVRSYTSGVYMLVYEDAAGVVTSKQFVVTK